MDFQQVVNKRKMVRSFDERPLEKADVDRILRNAQRGPSAGFSQGFEFLVLEGREQTSRYWDAMLPADRRDSFPWPALINAPLLVICLSHKQAYLRRYAEADKGWADMDEARWPVPYWDIDAGMAALLMLLTAVSAGLGACFFGVFDQQGLRTAFGIPDGFTAVGTIAIGYPAAADRPSGSLARGRRSPVDVIHRGSW
ncbi:MAG TPA: nitroreductase family protein [Dehalococcoidia bacterium]